MTTIADLLRDTLEKYADSKRSVLRETLDDDLPDALEDLLEDTVDEFLKTVKDRFIGI